MGWLIALGAMLLLGSAGVYFLCRLVNGAPFEDPGRR